MSKPTVLVDMDGVLVDFDGWIYDRREFWPSLTIERHEQVHYLLTEHVNKVDAKRMRREVENGDIFLDADPIEGAIAGMFALAEEADVWICTRPLEANPRCRDHKGAWLRKHLGPEFEHRMILTSDKSLVRGAVLLDDKPKTREVERAVWTPVVYAQPYNVQEPYVRWHWGMRLDTLLTHVERAAWG